MKENISRLFPVYFKGMAMGAADVVPGVSGGTIAFISGIYEHLISSIRAIDLDGIKILFKEGLPAFWKRIDGWFLSALFAGILTSVLSLARLIGYLLEHQPVGLWSFFFGLVLASAIAVGYKIKQKNALALVFFVLGSLLAWWIGTVTPAETPENLGFVFFSGALAICAMILPGISGSFILLLLRKYHFILDAVNNREIVVILVFMTGCLIGLISFAKLLGFLFKKFHDATIALLIGFMIGSLPVVWPWKNVLETRIDSKGVEVPFRYESVLPEAYQGEPQVLIAGALALFGFALILFIEKRFNRSEAV